MAEPGDNRPPDAPPLVEPAPAGARAPSTSFLDTPGTPPTTRSEGARWVLFAVIGFGAGQVVASLLVALAGTLAGQSGQLQHIESEAKPPGWYIGVSLVGVWAGLVAGPWLASRLRGTGRYLADLGVRFRPIDLAGVLIGVGSQYAIALAYTPFVTNSTKLGAPAQKLTGGSHGGVLTLVAIMIVVGTPFVEEVFFRGLLLRGLTRLFAGEVGPSRRRAVAVGGAIVVDGLLFGLAHFEWVQFAGLAAFGMVLALVAYRTGRLGMNMISHASFNLVAVVAVANSRGGLVH